MIKGIGASPGIAIGRAFALPSWEWELPDKMVDDTNLAREFERLYEGINVSKHELKLIKQDIADYIGDAESTIIDAHLAILEDPIFMEEVEAAMERQYKAAEVAVKEVIDKFVSMLDILDDEYMKERALDIKDVGNRLLKHLLGGPEIVLPAGDDPYIIVAKELSPSQLTQFDPSKLIGIVTFEGGMTSHTAIMARALGLPFVLGLEGKLIRPIQTGDLLIIDGDEGNVCLNPNDELIEKYNTLKMKWKQHRESLQRIAKLPATTLDQVEVRLNANISSVKELDLALSNGATGVGLFRTEFLYMDRETLPKEEELYQVYRSVVEKLGDRPIIFRTLDIGGDKQLDYLPFPMEDNPFLGYRAIRISLDRRDLFKTQLKAILRASVHGPVKLMYPMISSLEEVWRANEILELAKKELQAEGREYRANVEVGVMIEVPAAAMIADLLAQEVQFFSIGTNDLVQYVLAVDRMNEKIAHLYDPYHPAVLRMLRTIVEAAQRHDIPVSVCGELAGDTLALPFWLGLEVCDLSMSSQSLLTVKSKLLNTNASLCKSLNEEIFTCRTSDEVKTLLRETKLDVADQVKVAK